MGKITRGGYSWTKTDFTKEYDKTKEEYEDFLSAYEDSISAYEESFKDSDFYNKHRADLDSDIDKLSKRFGTWADRNYDMTDLRTQRAIDRVNRRIENMKNRISARQQLADDIKNLEANMTKIQNHNLVVTSRDVNILASKMFASRLFYGFLRLLFLVFINLSIPSIVTSISCILTIDMIDDVVFPLGIFIFAHSMLFIILAFLNFFIISKLEDYYREIQKEAETILLQDAQKGDLTPIDVDKI